MAVSIFSSSLSGLFTQSNAIRNISANISNLDSTGYKQILSSFTAEVSMGGEVSGSRLKNISTIDVQGRLENSASSTDLSAVGRGMFAVLDEIPKSIADPATIQKKFTRNGSFKQDADGFLVNTEGSHLMGWKVSKGDVYNASESSLELVNVATLGLKAVPTSKVSWNMNLNANEKVATGKETLLKINATTPTNYNIQKSDIIIPESDIKSGDGFNLTTDEGHKYSFKYGGITGGAKISATSSTFGAENASGILKYLDDGDQLIVNTQSKGDLIFTFNKRDPDYSAMRFNSLSTLAEAIDNVDGIAARVDNDKLFLAGNTADEDITFKSVIRKENTLSSNLIGIYGSDVARNKVTSYTASATNKLFDAATATDKFGVLPTTASSILGTRISDNENIRIALNTGKEFEFKYKDVIATGPPTGAILGQFNSLDTLRAAIDAVSNGKLTANVTSNTLDIKTVNKGDMIMSIKSEKHIDFAKELGIELDSVFDNIAVTNGDGINLAYGAYDKVQSDRLTNIDQNLDQVTSLTTIDISKGILGAKDENTIFDLADNDSITLADNAATANTVTLTFKSPGKGSGISGEPDKSKGEFNNLTTLKNAIDDNSNFSSTLNKGEIEIKTVANKFASITDGATNENKIASTLGIKFEAPINKEMFKITTDFGKDYSFQFLDQSNSSADISKGEFQTMEELKKAINKVSEGVLSADIISGQLVIEPGKIMASNIASISGVFANKFELAVNSKTFKLKFTGRGGGSASGSNPDIEKGEYNDLLSLKKAVSAMSDNTLSMNIGNNLNDLSLSVKDGVNIKYIVDENIKGNSSFATELGLKQKDMISSFGLHNLATDSNTFSNLDGLTQLIDRQNGVSIYSKGNDIGISSSKIVNGIDFVNLTDQKNNILKKLNLPLRIEPSYNATDQSQNMASGKVTPSFVHGMDVVDSLGASHKIDFAFLKTDNNKWLVEVYSAEKNTLSGSSRSDGLVAHGDLSFDGEGVLSTLNLNSIKSVTSTSGLSFAIDWANNANPSVIEMDFNPNLSKNKSQNYISIQGIRQYGGDFSVDRIKQDGIPIGEMTNLEITRDGWMEANFENGSVAKVYKIPLVSFANYEGLNLVNGNIYVESGASGTASYYSAGDVKVGHIMSKTLELSNVDLSEQLTKLVQAKHAYSGNAKAMKTSDSTLEELNHLFT